MHLKTYLFHFKCSFFSRAISNAPEYFLLTIFLLFLVDQYTKTSIFYDHNHLQIWFSLKVINKYLIDLTDISKEKS